MLPVAAGMCYVYFCSVRSFEKEVFLENLHSVPFGLNRERYLKPFVCFWVGVRYPELFMSELEPTARDIARRATYPGQVWCLAVGRGRLASLSLNVHVACVSAASNF